MRLSKLRQLQSSVVYRALHSVMPRLSSSPLCLNVIGIALHPSKRQRRTPSIYTLCELEAENRLSLNIHTHIVAAPEKAGEREGSLAALLNVAEAFESRHVHTRFVKFFLDSAPLPPQSTQCDLNDHGAPGAKYLLLDYDRLLEELLEYDARNMTCKIHAAGQGSVRLALNTCEAMRKNNSNGPKHELPHCNAVCPGT